MSTWIPTPHRAWLATDHPAGPDVDELSTHEEVIVALEHPGDETSLLTVQHPHRTMR
jgi:hypothetical protein